MLTGHMHLISTDCKHQWLRGTGSIRECTAGYEKDLCSSPGFSPQWPSVPRQISVSVSLSFLIYETRMPEVPASWHYHN